MAMVDVDGSCQFSADSQRKSIAWCEMESNDAVHTIDTGTRIVQHSVNGAVA